MRITVIECDRCGKRIGEPISLFFEKDGVRLEEYGKDIDLCEKCCKDIISIVKTVQKKTAKKEKTETQELVVKETEDATETEEKMPKTRKLDGGKAVALRAAGWTNRKIADELHVTEAAIANFFVKYEMANGPIKVNKFRESEWYSGCTENEHIYCEPKGKV